MIRTVFDKLAGVRRWQAWILVLVLDIVAVFGISNLQYDDGLVRTFQSKTPSFELFSAVQEKFPDLGRESFLLLEADDFSRFDSLVAVSDFVLEVQLIRGVTGAISPLAVPVADSGDGIISLLPARRIADADLYAHMQNSRAASPNLQRLLSQDLSSMLVVLQLADPIPPDLFSNIEKTGAEIFNGTGVTMTQTGYPVMRDVMLKRLTRDFILLNIIGAVAGTLIAAIALNSFLLAFVTAMSAGTAVVWVLGIMGLTGTQINVITVALPLMILVLSFADALHLSFETRRQVKDGSDRKILLAIHRIGPACILASVTTAFAFFVLALSSSSLVAEMGRAGIMAALLSVTAVLVVHPMLYATLARLRPLETYFTGKRGAPSSLANWTFLPEIARRWPRSIAVMAVVLLISSTSVYFTSHTNFSLFENFPPGDPLRQSVDKIERDFGPIGALQFATSVELDNRDEQIAQAVAVLERHSGELASVSLADFQDFSELDSGPDPLPDALINRFVSRDGTRALVTLAFNYKDARTTRQIVAKIEAGLAADPEGREIFPTGATGLEAMSAFTSAEMLQDMNVGFLIAVVASGVLIGLWLRDPLIGLIALIPNVLPIALVGAWLALSGRGLEFSSGIALTIAFGLAIDDTVHVINRIRLNLGQSRDQSAAQIIKAVNEVLPALVITSAVLSIGLIGTQFASLQSLAYFGVLSICVFILALLADLVVLPALFILVAQRHTQRRGK